MNQYELLVAIRQACDSGARCLSLDNKGIRHLPPEIEDLVHLEELDLSDNELTELPRQISQLHNLKVLRLEYNQIRQLPDDLFLLPHLEIIDLENNELSSLPATLSKAQQLRHFIANGNQLKKLPDIFGQLKKLEYVEINNNALTQLPASIGGLRALKHLDVSQNRLVQLPSGFAQLQQLISLNLSYNRLWVFPESISHLKNLRHLHLNHNQIDVLPSSIENLTQLQSLSLKDNSLDNLPEAICELSALQELLLNNNKIQKLPRHLVNLFKLKNIEVEQNPLIFPPLEVAQQGIFALKHYLRCEAKLIEGKKINIRKIEAPATYWTSALMFYFSYLPWFLKEVKKVDAVITTTASEKGIIIEAELCDSMDLALYQQYLSEFLNLMYWEKPTYSHNIQSYNNTYESRKHWLVVHNMLLHLEAMMLLFGIEKEQFEQFMAKSEIHQRNNERLMRPSDHSEPPRSSSYAS